MIRWPTRALHDSIASVEIRPDGPGLGKMIELPQPQGKRTDAAGRAARLSVAPMMALMGEEIILIFIRCLENFHVQNHT